jgi:hypothetical protein
VYLLTYISFILTNIPKHTLIQYPLESSTHRRRGSLRQQYIRATRDNRRFQNKRLAASQVRSLPVRATTADDRGDPPLLNVFGADQLAHPFGIIYTYPYHFKEGNIYGGIVETCYEDK